MVTGTISSHMILELFGDDDKYVCSMNDDAALLGSYPIEDQYRIHVKCKSGVIPTVNYEDTSQVEKYEISDDLYNKRTDSVRAIKERARLAQAKNMSEDDVKAELEKKNELIRLEVEALSNITIGDRCEVVVPKQLAKRGVVMFKGATEFQPGKWIGVKYDEPVGKNNGSVKGKQYFECGDKCGGFVKYTQIKCGDYPEKSLFEDEDEEM